MTLVNVNLMQAFGVFLSCITKHKTDPAILDAVYQEKLERLDQYMDVLTKLASAGMEEQLSPLLSTLLEEWAIKEAVELLLRYPGCVFNPADQELQQSFQCKLERQHQALSSELLQLQQAKEARARTQEERSRDWQSIAARTFESQQSQQQQWMQHQQQLNQQWFQGQREMFNQFQQANQQWANTALTGVQQAQLGMQQWYGFAASTQANVANMLAGTEQRQAAVVEQAVHQANMKKWAVRMTIIGLVLVGIVGLFGGAFIAMMHLYSAGGTRPPIGGRVPPLPGRGVFLPTPAGGVPWHYPLMGRGPIIVACPCMLSLRSPRRGRRLPPAPISAICRVERPVSERPVG